MRVLTFALALIFSLFFAPSQAAQVNKIAATVNGQVITMFDLQKEALPEFARARINPGDPAKSKETREIFQRVLDMMILDILVAQEAKRLKATVSDSEIDAEITRVMKERRMTKKQFEEQLAKQKLTPAALRKTIEKSVLRQKVMAMEVGRRVIVTPDEISKYYEANKDKLYKKDGLHMGVLVYSPKVDAQAIAARIRAKTMSFEEACAKYSIAPNKDKGGDAGPVEWNRLNPEWEERLNNMRPGDVTEIFNLQGHKAQVRLFRPGGGEEKPMSLQEAAPQIDAILRAPKARGRFEDYSKQLRNKAVIDVRL